jgi:hypothetical protein
VLAAVVMGVSAIAVTQRAVFSAPVGSKADTLRTADAAASTEPIETSLATSSQRAVFPYSVVPGGVDSVDELRSAIAGDPIVAHHYSGFDLSKARVERLAAPRFAHVSYRLGARVYWTRRPLVLPAGERVITDGKMIARTRCGNQVAAEPGITSPAEPNASILDTPTIPMSPCPTCALAPVGAITAIGFVPPPSGLVSPPETATITSTPTLFADVASGPLNAGGYELGTPHDDSHVQTFDGPYAEPPLNHEVLTPVPEPGSLMLMLIGGGGFAVRRLAARRRAVRSASTASSRPR